MRDFKIFKIKVYRNNFIVYITALLFGCIALGVALCSMVVNDQVHRNESASLNEFNRIEASLDLAENKIDNYVLHFYSNSSLLRDFQCFFGNNAETYLTSRLNSSDNNASNSSVLDDMQQFVANNQYSIKEVAFQSPKQTNIMNFVENQGTSFKFSLPIETEFLPENDIDFGYIYSKELLNPQDIQKSMGSLRFVIDMNKVISGYVSYGIGKDAIMSERSALYFPKAINVDRKQDLRMIYSQGNATGKINSGFLNSMYYTVYNSKAHGYKFISTVNTYEIIENNKPLFILIIVGCLMVFVLMFIVISTFMIRDAKYLNRILTTIGTAKSGNFKKIELGHRKDELRMIAQELNEMYLQLNNYIETEYKLKLRQKDTEMKMLQQQVNPHFLYNTLEIIRSSALVNHDEHVADAVSNLGGMFRAMVKSEDVITIDQELNILMHYLKLMEFKFSGNFYYQIDVPQEIRDLKTVKFWMQPICENFFVHGYDSKCEFNLLIISGHVEQDAYIINFTNNGTQIETEDLKRINERLQNVSEESYGKIGLLNVSSRLRYFFNNHASMTISNNAESGVSISVRIEREN